MCSLHKPKPPWNQPSCLPRSVELTQPGSQHKNGQNHFGLLHENRSILVRCGALCIASTASHDTCECEEGEQAFVPCASNVCPCTALHIDIHFFCVCGRPANFAGHYWEYWEPYNITENQQSTVSNHVVAYLRKIHRLHCFQLSIKSGGSSHIFNHEARTRQKGIKNLDILWIRHAAHIQRHISGHD